MNKKVSLLECKNYDTENLTNILKISIENLGGLDKYISKDDRVLLKVNLLAKRKAEDAVTTHPAFIQALSTILIENGNKVLIGDSPGGSFTKEILSPLYEVCGCTDVAKKTGATLNYNVNSFEKENPRGLFLKRILVTDMINDVDKVISVSKFKTHCMMTFTGATKNMFGIIPGVTKAEYHLNMPDYDDFANALIDICLCADPVLSFMDGIVGMEGDGPQSGVPRQMNVVLASDSPFHLDKVACSIINLKYEDVPILKNAIKRGLCASDFSDIVFFGKDISYFQVLDYKTPEIILVNPVNNMPKVVNDLTNLLLQPRVEFNKNKCVGCGACAENCPAKIIEMEKNRPVADLENCIRCYCCQELCPVKAVKVKRPIMLKIITNGNTGKICMKIYKKFKK